MTALDAGAVPVCKPHVWGDEADEVRRAIEAEALSGSTPVVAEFESAFAAWLGVGHAVAVSSGTAALQVALDVLGVGPGDEVVVPGFTMLSPVLAVLRLGATPVPVDADRTWNIDVDEVARRITARTRAVVAVHTYGHPADVAALADVARGRGVALVEDAAEGLGARVGGRAVGTFGDVSCFSLYANKLLTTGEGGVVATHDAALAERLRWKRNLCFGEGAQRFEHTGLGYNFRLSGLNAAFGLAQLRHADKALAAKHAVADAYDAALAGVPGCTLPPRTPGVANSWWVYGVLIDPARARRDDVAAALAAEGIETRPFFTPVHRQPALAGLVPPAELPHAERLGEEGLYLPSFVGMDEATVRRVADALRRALEA